MPLLPVLWFNSVIVLIGVCGLSMPGVWHGGPAFYRFPERYRLLLPISALRCGPPRSTDPGVGSRGPAGPAAAGMAGQGRRQAVGRGGCRVALPKNPGSGAPPPRTSSRSPGRSPSAAAATQDGALRCSCRWGRRSASLPLDARPTDDRPGNTRHRGPRPRCAARPRRWAGAGVQSQPPETGPADAAADEAGGGPRRTDGVAHTEGGPPQCTLTDGPPR